MSNKEDGLLASLEKSVKKLRFASGHAVEQGEPLLMIQGLKFDILMLRAECCALRDMIKEHGSMDTTELQKRTKDYMDQYTSIIEQQFGMQFLDDGSVVHTARSLKGLAKPNIH